MNTPTSHWLFTLGSFLISPGRREEILGDLEERFQEIRRDGGSVTAILWLAGQLVRSSPSFLINTIYWHMTMLRHNLVSILRYFKRHIVYAGINILGLSIGMSAALLIGLFVHFELGFDRFHEMADRTFRVARISQNDSYMGSNRFAVTPGPLAPSMVEDLPDVESVVRVKSASVAFTENGILHFRPGLYADSLFFNTFTFEFLTGSPQTALLGSDHIVLTESSALRFLGSTQVLGQTIELELYGWGVKRLVQVAGVISDPPPNSHLSFDYALSIQADPQFESDQDRWENANYFTYVTLRPGTAVAKVEASLTELVEHRRYGGILSDESSSSYELENISEIHLYSDASFQLKPGGDVRYVVIFGVIGVIILIIACINYTNLATARAMTRFREIGVRKAVGAAQRHIMSQFFGESILLSFVSLFIALGIAALALPEFSRLVDRPLAEYAPEWGELAWLLGAIALAVGLLSGFYPALVLSRFTPSLVLKGSSSNQGKGRSTIRSILVTGQFSAAIVLVVGALVVHNQMTFIRAMDSGINRENVLTFPLLDSESRQNYPAFRSALEQESVIASVAGASHAPIRISSSTSVRVAGSSSSEDYVRTYYTSIDDRYINLFGLGLIEGTGFDIDFPGELANGLLMNQAAATALGLLNPVGTEIDMWGNNLTVLGVLDDFNFQSYKQGIEPLVVRYAEPGKQDIGQVFVKIADGSTVEAIARTERLFRSFAPEYPFTYEFLDSSFDAMYSLESRLGRAFTAFTLLALIIACLGLFGMASFMATCRAKEIGIRRVLGGSVGGIVVLLSREMTLPVIIAGLLAIPTAWFFMDRWLQDFTFRVDLGIGVFLAAFGLSLVIAWTTVSMQSLRMATRNPVQALRSE